MNYPLWHHRWQPVSTDLNLQSCWTDVNLAIVLHAAALQAHLKTLWYDIQPRRSWPRSMFFPRVNAALMLAPVSWASTYPTIPCCRSLQNELFNFRLVPQTSARCVMASRQPAHTAAWWNVRHARVQTPVTVFLFHCLVLPCPCDNGPCCVLMSQCCLIKSGQWIEVRFYRLFLNSWISHVVSVIVIFMMSYTH